MQRQMPDSSSRKERRSALPPTPSLREGERLLEAMLRALDAPRAVGEDPVRFARRAKDLESAGVDLVWSGEIYGFDLVSTLAYLAGRKRKT